MLKKFAVYFYVLICTVAFQTKAQELQPFGQFQTDSIAVGEVHTYSLSFRYPVGLEVVFPDSTFSFFPFEYENKVFFNTNSDSIASTDSVVYYLSSFEVDPVQYLALPVFLIIDGDSTEIKSNPDSVFFRDVVRIVADTVQLKENIAFEEVAGEFNYPYLLIALGVLLLAAILTLIFFGKDIKKRIQLYWLKKENEKFNTSFAEIIQSIERDSSGGIAENGLSSWKKYLEKLQEVPYTKLTSKEILKRQSNGRLKEALTGIDRLIYGSRSDGDVSRFYYELEDFAREQYNLKVEQIQNG